MVKILLKLSKILDMMSAQLRFVAMELKERPDTQLWFFVFCFFFPKTFQLLRCRHSVSRQMGLTQVMTLEASPAKRIQKIKGIYKTMFR